jgi:hypothetical protein
VNVHFQHIRAQLHRILLGKEGIARPNLLPALVGNDEHLAAPTGEKGVIRRRSCQESEQ